jgi:hypothetical protein
MGQEGSYIITDPEEQSLGLPKGKYDFPIVIGAKLYHDDGSLRYDTNNSIGLWGDIIQVYVCGGCCIVVSTKGSQQRTAMAICQSGAAEISTSGAQRRCQ